MEEVTLTNLFGKKTFNHKKFNLVHKNQFLIDEFKFITEKLFKGVEYYKYLIDNVEHIDNSKNNSYILWIYNKSEILVENKPTNIYHGNKQLPDIDCDFPVFFRENVIDYIRQKYGNDKVCQVATFGRIQGRMAIREILRSNSSCPMDIINSISKKIPQESEIADKLEEQKETSIIRWTLKNEPHLLEEYCKLEDGKLTGEFAPYFEDAIEIEGTLKAYGKHASALVIYDKNVSDYCPMLSDKSTKEPLAGIPYEFLEKMGMPKFDILGLRSLDFMMAVRDLVKYGKVKFNLEKEKTQDEL